MKNSNIPFRTMIDLVEAANRIDEQGSDPFNWRKGDTLPIHQRNPKRFEVFAGLFDYSGFGMGNYHSKGGRRIWTDRANAERLAKSDGVELVVHDRFGDTVPPAPRRVSKEEVEVIDESHGDIQNPTLEKVIDYINRAVKGHRSDKSDLEYAIDDLEKVRRALEAILKSKGK